MQSEASLTNSLTPECFSDFQRFLRVKAWVTRFVTNCACPASERRSGQITLEEVSAIESAAITEAQQKSFKQEHLLLQQGRCVPANSKLSSLNPFLDEDGVMRCNGRLNLAYTLPYDARCPIILPRDDPLTKLIVKHYHDATYHGGTNQTLAALSERFWIPAGREAVRQWEKICRHCTRMKAFHSRATDGTHSP